MLLIETLNAITNVKVSQHGLWGTHPGNTQTMLATCIS